MDFRTTISRTRVFLARLSPSVPERIRGPSSKASHLLLLLSAHFALLSLAFGYNWIHLFFVRHQVSLLVSALFLSAFYIGLLRLLPILNKKGYNFALFVYAITPTSLISLVYFSFFASENLQKIIASAVFFMAVAALIAFCDSGKLNAVWNNLKRIALMALFILSGLFFFHLYVDLFLHPETLLRGANERKYQKETTLLNTAFYQLHLTRYNRPIPFSLTKPMLKVPTRSYISALDNKNFLMISGRGGMIYHLTLRKTLENGFPEEDLYIRKLSFPFPVRQPPLKEGQRDVMPTVNDIYAAVENGRRVFYVSHNFWDSQRKCITQRVSKLEDSVSILLEDKVSPKWRTLYETVPCFSMEKPGKCRICAHAGGRIIGLDKNSLLLSVGDYRKDGVTVSESFSQDMNGSYGKIWKINRNTGDADLISIGHRNPQGLYRAPNGLIWETEHGPQGGDELNKIKAGKNYGWPLVTYGTDYGQTVWPLSERQDEHEGYEQPVFVWTPSIGVSNLIGVERDLFPVWKHDLLVASLRGKTLYRLQMHKERVIYSEPINIGFGIRDVTETPNGEIFMWAGRGRLIRLRPADSVPRYNETIEEAGERLFHKCAGCHSIKPGAPHGIGPNLHKVYNGRIAGQVEYDYSQALQAESSRRWTEDRLDLFLKNPEDFSPGTKMQMKIPDEYERRALLRYLENN